MNACPPQPGLTLMQSTRSATSAATLDAPRPGPGVERDTGERTGLVDRARASGSRAVGLDVEGDAVGAGLGELRDLAWGVDHQVDVEHAAGVVDQVGDGADDQRARS